MTIEHFQPFEIEFFAGAAKDRHSFPGTTLKYDDRYKSKVNSLQTSIYRSIDAGLSALSEDTGGIYTGHDSAHFDEVIKYAYMLLGKPKIEEKTSSLAGFSPFEIYMLLMAIRIHDVGNIVGRELHETRCLEVLQEISDISDDTFEINHIVQIAQAHGGRHRIFGKDTIGALPEVSTVGSCDVRMRTLAAITRFADEICETSRRAATFLLLKDLLPEQSKIYHQYAYSIKSVSVNSDRILRLTYQIDDNLLLKTWASPKGECYLSDYILDRLEKLNTERIYYNQFVDARFQVNNIEARVQVVHGIDVKYEETIKTVKKGYPDTDTANSWRCDYSALCGKTLSEKLGVHDVATKPVCSPNT